MAFFGGWLFIWKGLQPEAFRSRKVLSPMIKRVKFIRLYGYDQSDDFYEHQKDESD